jgi:hypothetical protein
MHKKKFTAITLISIVAVWFFVMGCDEDSNYDSRTVVYVSSINDNAPYLSDVLNQGDSIYDQTGTRTITNDDFIEEDWLKVTFYNKPYNGIVGACGSNLGDFLVTDYSVEFVDLAGGASPVIPFTGQTSILVPCNTMVEGYILIVPMYAKLISPLVDMQYTAIEVMTIANITFKGHEVQTDRIVEFSCGVTVNFADPLEIEE